MSAVVTAARPDRAWGIMIMGFLVTLLSTGARFSVGPFMGPMLADFQFSNTHLSTVVAAGMLLYGLGMPVAGRLADRFGTPPVLAGGGLLLGASLALTAWTRSPLVFAVAFGLLASLGFAGTSHVVLSSIISRHFDRHRGLAMTFVSAGSMGGIAIMTPLSAAMVQWMGWRNAYYLFALLFVLLLVPGVLLFMRPPAAATGHVATLAPGLQRPGANWLAALGTRPFWFLLLSFFGCGFSMNLLSAHGVPMLEHHGFSKMTASFGIGLIGLISVFGSVAIGALSDRLGRRAFLAIIYAVRGLGFIGLLYAGVEWELYAVGAVGGLVWAGSSALTSTLTADLYGVESVGTLFGVLYVGHQLGAAAGAYLGGWGLETFGSYNLAFGTAAGLLFAGAWLAMRLPGRSALPGAPAGARA